MSKKSRTNKITSTASGFLNQLAFVGFIIVVGACIVLYISYNPRAEDLPPVEPIVYSSVSVPEEADGENVNEDPSLDNGAADGEEPPPVANIPRDEWYMRLVNYANWLEEDFVSPVINIGDDFYFDERAAAELQAFINAANGADVGGVRITSASRSWENQQARYETRIDELVDEGYSEDDAAAQATRENELPVASEHILSLGVDILPENNQEMDETILGEAAYLWLCEHAHEYGFIQRYPLGKGEITGIEFEPWHFRFVGVEQATLIYQSGLTLEEYLA